MSSIGSSLIKRLSEIRFSPKLFYKSTSEPQNLEINTDLQDSKIKPFCDIPARKSLLPSFVELILGGGPEYLHEHCDKRHNELGPIYREHLGPIELVFLADTKLIQTVIANEGQYPHHNVPESWKFYNHLKKVKRGLFFQTGEPWARLRKAFNKVLLAEPKNITRYTCDVLKINSDLLDYWQAKHEPNSKDFVIDDVKLDLCKWSIEATGFMLFGGRLGCVTSSHHTPSTDRAEELVKNVFNMFIETSRFQLLPVAIAHKLKLGAWRRFETATTNMIRIANEYVQENIAKIRRNETQNSLVEDLLALETLSDKEVSDSVVDLIIAAADTTSNSLQWMLYLLAKHQDVQLKILNETSPLFDCPDNFKDNIPYLKAFVREVSRLYPTAPFLARTLDKDVILGNYTVPAGKTIVFSLFTTSRMEVYFEKPLEFRPERWQRTGNMATGCPRKTNHAYASLPFGAGARMCIGRRAAELELCLFIASFVRKFHSSLLDTEESLGVKLNMILCPDKPIKLRLRSRKSIQVERE